MSLSAIPTTCGGWDDVIERRSDRGVPFDGVAAELDAERWVVGILEGREAPEHPRDLARRLARRWRWEDARGRAQVGRALAVLRRVWRRWGWA